MKEKRTFTLNTDTVAKLNTLSQKSVQYLGRHTSMSEIVDILVRKAFLDKKQQLVKRLNDLDKERDLIVAELEEVIDKNRIELANRL